MFEERANAYLVFEWGGGHIGVSAPLLLVTISVYFNFDFFELNFAFPSFI